MSTDLTFITNEPNRNLLDRFKVLIKDTELFDVLVGYFFTSGLYAIYKSLEKTKKIKFITTEEMPEHKIRASRKSATELLKILKAMQRDVRQFTDEQKIYLKTVMRQIEKGGLPKQTSKKTLQELNKELKKSQNPLKILAVLQKNIPSEFLKEHISESSAQTFGPPEVILSEYLIC